LAAAQLAAAQLAAAQLAAAQLAVAQLAAAQLAAAQLRVGQLRAAQLPADRCPPPSCSTLRVQIQLVSHHVFIDAVREVLSEAISERQQQIVDPVLVQDPCQYAACLSAVILTQELADLLHGDIALEVQVEILE
jgi:hypothetical protein